MQNSNHRSLFQRLAGICATPKAEPASWRFAGGTLVVELALAPHLLEPGGAIRIEKCRGLPARVLLFRDADGHLHAVENRCSHAGRRLDPNLEFNELECCSLGRSQFDFDGQAAGGQARKSLRVFTVEEHDGRIVVHV